MVNEGHFRYQEPEPERHAFSLCRVTDAGTFDQGYDLLGVVQVTVDRRDPKRLTPGLLPWALATLASGGYGFGRYYAAYTTLDEDDEPYHSLAEEYVDWSGSEVLAPAGQQPAAQR
ncbi:hypothetical protein [Micromonospora zhanjiangensis]|uniref:Uncharacterized protein n=1 Tax=Micromonospora zhanjiangensis TaxID=1522057 RepID=A0ABV8KRX0_9ACTN